MEGKVLLLHPEEKQESTAITNEYPELGDCESEGVPGDSFLDWNFTTARLAELATIPFLLMQIPQIVLNTRNLLAGNDSDLFAVDWMAQLTSLMGNLSLLSYFVSKKERGASIVQAVDLISDGVWKAWLEITCIGGVYVLTQVVWSTFVPYLPRSKLPGIVSAVLILVLIELARWGQLPSVLLDIAGGISGWVATLLFMWSPVSQLKTIIRNPANLHGLSVFTILLALIGNGLLIPRALFIRDLMWFIGCSWGSSVQGWGILLSMYINKATSSVLFLGVTCGFVLWLGTIAIKDMHAYSLTNPVAPFLELLKGKRKYETSK